MVSGDRPVLREYGGRRADFAPGGLLFAPVGLCRKRRKNADG